MNPDPHCLQWQRGGSERCWQADRGASGAASPGLPSAGQHCLSMGPGGARRAARGRGEEAADLPLPTRGSPVPGGHAWAGLGRPRSVAPEGTGPGRPPGAGGRVPPRRGPARPLGSAPGQRLRLPGAAMCGGPRARAARRAPAEVWERRAGLGQPGSGPNAGQGRGGGNKGEPEFHGKPVKISACVRAPPTPFLV